MKLIPSNLYISYINIFYSQIDKFNANVIVIMRLWSPGLIDFCCCFPSAHKRMAQLTK